MQIPAPCAVSIRERPMIDHALSQMDSDEDDALSQMDSDEDDTMADDNNFDDDTNVGGTCFYIKIE